MGSLNRGDMSEDELRKRVEARLVAEAKEIAEREGIQRSGYVDRTIEAEGQQLRVRVPRLRRTVGTAEEKGVFLPPYYDELKREREERRNAPETAAPEPEVAAPRAVSPPALPELPSAPLRDSLSASRAQLGDAALLDIRARAQQEAIDLDLGQLSEQELREGLPEENPFDLLPEPGRADPQALSEWWGRHGAAAVRTAALEEQLIEQASKAYAELAERECERRGETWPDSLRGVTEVRGAEFADKVERHATLLASELGSMPEDERDVRAAALRDEIRETGLGTARFAAIAQSVALQHGRNATNQLSAARAQEAAAGAELAAEQRHDSDYQLA